MPINPMKPYSPDDDEPQTQAAGALAGLRAAAPQTQAIPITGAAPSHPSYENPQASINILNSPAMRGNAAAMNQGMLGGYGSMEELRRHATLPDSFMQNTSSDLAGAHGYGSGQATGTQAYAQGILGKINAGAERAEAVQQKVADQGIQRQFAMPFEREQAIYKAQTALNPDITRAAEAEAGRSPAAISGRAQIDAARANALGELDKARLAATAKLGAGADEDVKGRYALIQELIKQRTAAAALNTDEGRALQGYLDKLIEMTFLKSGNFVGGQPGAEGEPQGPPLPDPGHGMTGHDHSIFENITPRSTTGVTLNGGGGGAQAAAMAARHGLNPPAQSGGGVSYDQYFQNYNPNSILEGLRRAQQQQANPGVR